MSPWTKEDFDEMFENPPFHPDPLMNFVAKVIHGFHKRAEDANDAILAFLYSQTICAEEFTLDTLMQSTYLVDLLELSLRDHVCEEEDLVYKEKIREILENHASQNVFETSPGEISHG